ncbi:MAG: hypothetical protein IPM29_02440 [Planctomycetes bacterium]|nr:hypothetical protein [Planctomycetota bacterium]
MTEMAGRNTDSRTHARPRLRAVAAFCSMAVLACLPDLAVAQGGGGNVVQADIAAELTFADLAGPTGVTGDGAEYSDANSGEMCAVGRRRTISMALAQRSPRWLSLQLGPELPPVDGDDSNNPSNNEFLDFFATHDVPDPSGVVTEVVVQIAGRHNVSGLGWTIVDGVPYCNPNLEPIEPTPGLPETYSWMCTDARIDFNSGPHQWRLYFGVGAWAWTNPANSPVLIHRNPVTDPTDTTEPWVTHALPWSTTPVTSDIDELLRLDKVVGFLYYRGTKRQDPYQYAGAFEVPWSCVTFALPQ